MSKRDLFLMVPDIDVENVLVSLLCGRQESLSIALDFDPERDLLRNNRRDPGCYQKSAEIFRNIQDQYRHALVCFDHQGSGVEQKTRDNIEAELECEFKNSGWEAGAAAAVVIKPEIEIWAWADSAHVAEIMGWQEGREALDAFLENNGLKDPHEKKPMDDPKEAMARAMREKKKPLVAGVFKQLSKRVGISRCSDPAFQKLKNTLQTWFPGKTGQ